MELTPRTLGAPSEPPSARYRRSRWRIVVLVVLLAGVGFVVWQGLTNATRYFYNADEAVERRDSLGDTRFRLQGTVQEGSVDDGADEVRFAVEFNGVAVDVRHEGDPKELFREGIPVVVEGRWEGEGDRAVFVSDEMVVKHSNEYRADEEYDERVGEAEQGGSGGVAP